ncbi:Cytochrome bo(3) ubiquinol oxidase subunit 4 [Serratia symbiotica]|nr:Cytochrome bo(3) ubiquinol oxidase subunit 4 [Serratia symbiotica]
MNFLFNKNFNHKVNSNNFFSYFVGFILSIVFTVIPFLIVKNHNISHIIVFLVIISMAILQIIVHLFYFLHINFSFEDRWNLIALLFTIIVISIILIGSFWIMYHLNMNMKIS